MAGLVKPTGPASARPLPLLLVPALAPLLLALLLLALPLFFSEPVLEEALLSFLLPVWTALPAFSFAELLLLLSFPEVLALAALAFALSPSFISNPRRHKIRQLSS